MIKRTFKYIPKVLIETLKDIMSFLVPTIIGTGIVLFLLKIISMYPLISLTSLGSFISGLYIFGTAYTQAREDKRQEEAHKIRDRFYEPAKVLYQKGIMDKVTLAEIKEFEKLVELYSQAIEEFCNKHKINDALKRNYFPMFPLISCFNLVEEKEL